MSLVLLLRKIFINPCSRTNFEAIERVPVNIPIQHFFFLLFQIRRVRICYFSQAPPKDDILIVIYLAYTVKIGVCIVTKWYKK